LESLEGKTSNWKERKRPTPLASFVFIPRHKEPSRSSFGTQPGGARDTTARMLRQLDVKLNSRLYQRAEGRLGMLTVKGSPQGKDTGARSGLLFRRWVPCLVVKRRARGNDSHSKKSLTRNVTKKGGGGRNVVASIDRTP